MSGGGFRRQRWMLFLQELKGSEFPATIFEELGYHSAAVTQKTDNGVAILSRAPMELVSRTLEGDELDTHARFLEVMIEDVRLVNIYLPNGNPIGSDRLIGTRRVSPDRGLDAVARKMEVEGHCRRWNTVTA